MGIFDTVKGLAKKNEKQVDQGIDKTEAVAHDQVGDRVGTDKIDAAAARRTTQPTSSPRADARASQEARRRPTAK